MCSYLQGNEVLMPCRLSSRCLALRAYQTLWDSSQQPLCMHCRNIKRFQHYQQQWEGQTSSQQLEGDLRSKVACHIEQLEAAATTLTDYAWLTQVWPSLTGAHTSSALASSQACSMLMQPLSDASCDSISLASATHFVTSHVPLLP